MSYDPEFTLKMVLHGLRRPEQRELALKEYCRILSRPRTCDGCRHWNPEGKDMQSGDCMLERSIRHESRHDFFRAQDVEDPWFVTGPKFGCVHWEAKEP